eukprot:SAG31_NODE_39240_length_289_cov_4.857895_1_plen_33_part_10
MLKKHIELSSWKMRAFDQTLPLMAPQILVEGAH